MKSVGGFEPLEPRMALAADAFPSVQSITIAPGSTTAALAWTVVFSESVTGVDASDFALALDGVTAKLPLAVTGSGLSYTVTAANVAGSGEIGLNLVDNGTIRDLAGNPLGRPNAISLATSAPAIKVGPGPISVAVGDLNADGKLDIVAANYLGNTLSVLLGKGDGTFQPQRTFACGSFPYAVAVGDLNNDGTPDLATANYIGNTVSVLLGRGDGTFQPQQEFSAGAGPVSVSIGFFDGDAKADLVVANNNETTLSILLGKGDGTFRPQQKFTTVGSPASATVADFNGDTKADVAAASFGKNAVSVLLGSGDGTLQPDAQAGTDVRPWPVAVGDVNADGRPDIVTANTGTRTLSVLLGRGDGSFLLSSQQLLLKQPLITGSNPYSVVIADVNADGKPDVAVGNSGDDTLGVMLGRGTGGFEQQQTFATGKRPVGVAVGDFNGDRKPDVVTANYLGNTVGVLFGNLSGNFTGATALVDTIAPTIAITTTKAVLKAGETATVTFKLSENSATFSLADVVATGGTLSAFTGSGTSYRATFTPAATSTAPGTIAVAAGTFTDQAGNGNVAGALSPQLVIDTVVPTIAIKSGVSTLTTGQTTTITFTLSKPSRNFGLADVSAAGGGLSSFKAISDTVYTATFTAGTSTKIKGRISVAAGRFTDAVGNGNVTGSLATPITVVA